MSMNPRLLRPIATGFNPKTIAGLALWLDAPEYNASTGTWADKSGNGRNFGQDIAENRPIVSAVTQNGRAILELDGSNDQLIHNSNFLQVANCTLFAAFRRLGGAFGGVISSARISIASDRSPGILIDSSRGSIRGFFNVSYAAVAAVDSFNITSGTVTDGASVIFTNGTQIVSSAAASTLDTGNTTTTIGTYRTIAGNYLNGYIGEIIAYTRVLSVSERKKVEGYLGKKWGITVA
jgi:hypothetical protein